MAEPNEDVQAYLARIRKTIADSKRVVAQAELRIAETDRMLERQGLTREQVMAMRFSDAQKRAVDAELKRRGLDPLEWWGERDGDEEPPDGDNHQTTEPSNYQTIKPSNSQTSPDAELENRQRKFGMMMKPFQL